MNSTMKAAVVREFGKPLVIEEVSVPRPGAGEVLVKIEACGGLHTTAGEPLLHIDFANSGYKSYRHNYRQQRKACRKRRALAT